MTRHFLKDAAGAMVIAPVLSLLPIAAQAQEPPQPNEQMQAVLDKLTELGAKPLGTIGVEEARSQPTPADAVMAVMEEKGIETDQAAQAVRTEDITIPGPEGDIQARVYTPEGEGPFPVIVYYHGGGWVIADIDTYDASARALASGAEAIVVSSHYRQAPEHTFPAFHEDAWTAYQWVTENAADHDGDPERIAVAGESAGGNLAANVAIMAVEDDQVTDPLHQLLVYPIAGDAMTTESYEENANAQPLSREAMEWFFKQAFENPEQASDPRIDLVEREDLEGLPPATVITAQIDPLRSEGQVYAQNLEEAGVDVDAANYEGVTHEFFGMAAVVDEAKEANQLAAENLMAAFQADAGAVTGATEQ